MKSVPESRFSITVRSKESRIVIATATFISLIVNMPAAQAAGFSIPENSIAGISTANALVANPLEVGAITYNPAAMSFHENSSIAAAGMLFSTNLQVTTSSGQHDSESDEFVLIPALQGAFKIDDRISLGLGANVPFGLETAWPVGTFPQLSAPIGTLPAGLLHPTQTKLELISLVPSLAYRISEKVSIAAGVDYYRATKVVLNSALADIHGEGDAWGWNLSALYRSGPLSLGASYHSATTIDLDGHFQVIGMAAVEARANLDLPSRLQAGIRYAFSDALAAELDWTRTGWSHFKEIIVTSSASNQVLSRGTNHWEDVNAYRLALTYNIRPKTQLRFGYTYDQTGQDDEYFSARIPDADRHLFSLGIAQDLGDGWQLEAGYMYVLFDDHSYRANNPLSSNDPNGSNALNGDYEANVHISGLGINKIF
jgi:long-chain fatty acid transport protein